MKKTIVFISLLILLILLGCVMPTNKSKHDDDDDDDDDETIITKAYNPTNNILTGFTVDFLPAGVDDWTFMIYLDGDNNLDGYSAIDFQEMITGVQNANNDANINVLVLHDKLGGGNTILYELTAAGQVQIGATTERNMGDPANLSWFINYCKTNYAATHYALILWNHGDGARSTVSSDNQVITAKNLSMKSKSSLSSIQMSKAICEDDFDNDLLYLDELQQALNANFTSADKLDMIGFDACLMGTVEVAYEFKDIADYMCGSMANVWVNGWDYNILFSNMADDGSGASDARELSKLIVKQFRDSTTGVINQTMSAIDLSYMNNLKSAIDNLGVAIVYENKKSAIEITRDFTYQFFTNDYNSIQIPYYDLSDFANQIVYNNSGYSINLFIYAQNVITTLQYAVVCAYGGYLYGNYYGDGASVKRGLSIFISRGNLTYDSGYGPLSHYAYQWWYTSRNTVIDSGNSSNKYGLIDFCNSNSNGVVETWKELFEVWYDPTNTYTPTEMW